MRGRWPRCVEIFEGKIGRLFGCKRFENCSGPAGFFGKFIDENQWKIDLFFQGVEGGKFGTQDRENDPLCNPYYSQFGVLKKISFLLKFKRKKFDLENFWFFENFENFNFCLKNSSKNFPKNLSGKNRGFENRAFFQK